MTSARKLLLLVLGAALVGAPVSADQNQASRSPQLPREKVGILQGIFDASLGNLGLIFVNIGLALKTPAEREKLLDDEILAALIPQVRNPTLADGESFLVAQGLSAGAAHDVLPKILDLFHQFFRKDVAEISNETIREARKNHPKRYNMAVRQDQLDAVNLLTPEIAGMLMEALVRHDLQEKETTVSRGYRDFIVKHVKDFAQKRLEQSRNRQNLKDLQTELPTILGDTADDALPFAAQVLVEATIAEHVDRKTYTDASAIYARARRNSFPQTISATVRDAMKTAASPAEAARLKEVITDRISQNILEFTPFLVEATLKAHNVDVSDALQKRLVNTIENVRKPELKRQNASYPMGRKEFMDFLSETQNLLIHEVADEMAFGNPNSDIGKTLTRGWGSQASAQKWLHERVLSREVLANLTPQSTERDLAQMMAPVVLKSVQGAVLILFDKIPVEKRPLENDVAKAFFETFVGTAPGANSTAPWISRHCPTMQQCLRDAVIAVAPKLTTLLIQRMATASGYTDAIEPVAFDIATIPPSLRGYFPGTRDGRYLLNLSDLGDAFAKCVAHEAQKIPLNVKLEEYAKTVGDETHGPTATCASAFKPFYTRILATQWTKTFITGHVGFYRREPSPTGIGKPLDRTYQAREAKLDYLLRKHVGTLSDSGLEDAAAFEKYVHDLAPDLAVPVILSNPEVWKAGLAKEEVETLFKNAFNACWDKEPTAVVRVRAQQCLGQAADTLVFTLMPHSIKRLSSQKDMELTPAEQTQLTDHLTSRSQTLFRLCLDNKRAEFTAAATPFLIDPRLKPLLETKWPRPHASADGGDVEAHVKTIDTCLKLVTLVLEPSSTFDIFGKKSTATQKPKDLPTAERALAVAKEKYEVCIEKLGLASSYRGCLPHLVVEMYRARFNQGLEDEAPLHMPLSAVKQYLHGPRGPLREANDCLNAVVSEAKESDSIGQTTERIQRCLVKPLLRFVTDNFEATIRDLKSGALTHLKGDLLESMRKDFYACMDGKLGGAFTASAGLTPTALLETLGAALSSPAETAPPENAHQRFVRVTELVKRAAAECGDAFAARSISETYERVPKPKQLQGSRMWNEVRKLFTVDGAINLREILKTRASDPECTSGPESVRVFKPTTEQDSKELLELLNNVVDLMENREQEVSPAMIEFVEKINNKSIKNLDEFIDELEKPGSVMDTYLFYIIHEKFVAELDEVSENLRNKLALTLLTAIPRTLVVHKPQIEENNRHPLDEPYEVGKTHEPYVLAPAAKYEESVISSMKKKILEPMRRGEAPQAKRVEKEMAPWIARAILSDKTFFDQLVVGSVLERFANKSLGFWGSIGYTLFGNAVIDVLRSKQYYYQLRQVYFHMTGLKAMRASATEDERARLEADIQADKDKIERLITAGVKGNIDPLPDGEKPEP